MSITIPLERQAVQVPDTAVDAANQALWVLGVSAYRQSRSGLTALIRLGSKGSADRLAIYQVELRFTAQRAEQVQWLTMCWNLPGAKHPILLR